MSNLFHYFVRNQLCQEDDEDDELDEAISVIPPENVGRKSIKSAAEAENRISMNSVSI